MSHIDARYRFQEISPWGPVVGDWWDTADTGYLGILAAIGILGCQGYCSKLTLSVELRIMETGNIGYFPADRP